MKKIPRQPCAWCHQGEPSHVGSRFCSRACYGKARKAARPPLPMCRCCGEKPVSKRRGHYCGKSCAGVDVPRRVTEARARGWVKAKETQRRQYAERLRARLLVSLQPVFDAHPEWSADVRLELLKAAVAVHKVAYRTGWSARTSRLRREAA